MIFVSLFSLFCCCCFVCFCCCCFCHIVIVGFVKLEFISNCSSAINLCFLFNMYVNELTAYRPQVCWCAHQVFIVSLFRTFLFKPNKAARRGLGDWCSTDNATRSHRKQQTFWRLSSGQNPRSEQNWQTNGFTFYLLFPLKLLFSPYRYDFPYT